MRKRLARRHRRVRGKISGTPERPRLCVTRSNIEHLRAGSSTTCAGKTTVCGVSTLGPEFKATGKNGANVEGATALGDNRQARMAQECGITAVVFDRGGNLYHGRIKALHHLAEEAIFESGTYRNTTVLQSGGIHEDQQHLAHIVDALRIRLPATAVPLNVGEHPADSYILWKPTLRSPNSMRHGEDVIMARRGWIRLPVTL